MQNHLGEHILSGLFKSKYDLDNKGFHLSDDTGAFDIDAKEITEEMTDEIERLANEIVYSALPVETERGSSNTRSAPHKRAALVRRYFEKKAGSPLCT